MQRSREVSPGISEHRPRLIFSKAPQGSGEQTVLVDADAAIARSAASVETGKLEEPKENIPGGIEPCEDCR